MTAEPPSRGRLGPFLWLTFASILAIWLYRPWFGRPFDVIDFADFLPHLAAGHSFSERVAALVHYYGTEHGRFNLVAYVGLAIKWGLFGSAPLPWQLVRAGEMLVATGGTYLLLRRLAASRWGASLGATVILFSFAASHAWVRLPVPEPLGLSFALAAALFACAARTSPRWRLLAVASGLSMVLAILTKETLIGWVPVVAYLGCYLGADGRLGPLRKPDIRGIWVLVNLAVGAVATAIPIFLVARSKQGGSGYTSMIGRGGLNLGRAAELFQRMLLPWPVAQGAEPAVNSLSAVVFLVMLIGALWTAGADPEWRAHVRRVMVLGLAMPVIGTLLYLPWPTYWAPYGLPFLVGFALLLATAVSAAERRSRQSGVAGRLLAALGILLVVPQPVYLVRRLAARQDLNVALSHSLLSRTGSDSLIVALAVPPQPGVPGMGSALRKYALVLDPAASLPPAIDAHCPDVVQRLRRGLTRTMLISYTDQCGRLPISTVTVRQSFRYFDLARLRIVGDSVEAQLLDTHDASQAPH